jgi:pSer/pThr/pTyr-binding forkhead associated (FHA) protein
MRAQLIPLDGSPPIDILKDLVVVGRKEDCDLRLDHKSVSKQHCVIVKTDGLLLLRDLGSTNGTRVNNTRVRRAALLPNDSLSIAHFRFRVFLGPDEPQSPRQASPRFEHTQALDARDLVGLLQPEQAPPRSNRDALKPELQRNQLPDVYPEEKGG